MGWKPSAPVSVDEAITWQAQLHGMSVEDYLKGSSTSNYTPGYEQYDLSDWQQGNPFFTEYNQPAMGTISTSAAQRPSFLWEGNNKSLRKASKATYDAFWDQQTLPGPSTQQATWEGPEIRPLYDDNDIYGGGELYSNSLSDIGMPNYWQDNNDNQLYEAPYDDLFDGTYEGASQSAQTAVDNSLSQQETPTVDVGTQQTPTSGLSRRFGLAQIFRNSMQDAMAGGKMPSAVGWDIAQG